jgi:hypothetical protein
LARLIKAYLYFHALSTRRDSTARLRMRIRGTDVRIYNWSTLVGESVSQDTAFVYCNDAKDINYIFFLYIISKEFGIAPLLLQNEVEGMDTVFRQYLLHMPPEANRLVIILNEAGNWDDAKRERDLDFDCKNWHAYIIQYGRSVQLEGRLAEAKAISMSMIYGDYLPAVHTERQVSFCELYMGAMSERMSSESVPIEECNTAQLMGALTGNCLALLRYKDIRSNEMVKQYDEGARRKFDNRILGNTVNRQKFYTLLQDDGMLGIAAALESLDCINVLERFENRERRILDIRARDLWMVMPSYLRDDRCVFENGLSSTFWTNVWSTGDRATPIRHIESEKRLALLAQLGVLTNADTRKGLVRVNNPTSINYDPVNYAMLANNLMEGKIGTVRIARMVMCQDRDQNQSWSGLDGSSSRIIAEGQPIMCLHEIFERLRDDILPTDTLCVGLVDMVPAVVNPLVKERYHEKFRSRERTTSRRLNRVFDRSTIPGSGRAGGSKYPP